MAAANPCPMQMSSADASHASMDCCDDDKGAPGHKAPCKPGMACFASAAALPAAAIDVLAITFDHGVLAATPTRMLLSRPPDRTLRPPISL